MYYQKRDNENVEKCEQSKQLLYKFGRFRFIFVLIVHFFSYKHVSRELKMYTELQ